jgi:uncharacterized protein (DUF433 family)
MMKVSDVIRKVIAASITDIRFDTPLYTTADAARAVGVSPATRSNWAKGYARPRPGRPTVKGAPVVTAFPSSGLRQPTIPFVGLSEALVLAAVRRSGVPLQRVRPALEVLSKDLGIDHALASRRLYSDGAEILFDYAERSSDPDAPLVRQLLVVRNQQRVFSEAVEQYLRLIEYASDGYVRRVRLPGYQEADVVADPDRSFGQPIFSHGGAKVTDVLERFWAGEDLDTLVAEFGVPRSELEDVVRVASRRAA